MNPSRWGSYVQLKTTGVPVEGGSGGSESRHSGVLQKFLGFSFNGGIAEFYGGLVVLIQVAGVADRVPYHPRRSLLRKAGGNPFA
ncbi:MAG: hypothetical protein M0Z36_04580 [Thermaerobacter sp.]|nr:hypothetical protein [Thermaerobacter sp.]